MEGAGVRPAAAAPRLDTIMPWMMPQFLSSCEPRPVSYESLCRHLWDLRSVVEGGGAAQLPGWCAFLPTLTDARAAAQ
eukprot:1249752-Alexandrium_andersonii.AAC.1